jgi:hypothetical protein
MPKPNSTRDHFFHESESSGMLAVEPPSSFFNGSEVSFQFFRTRNFRTNGKRKSEESREKLPAYRAF